MTTTPTKRRGPLMLLSSVSTRTLVAVAASSLLSIPLAYPIILHVIGPLLGSNDVPPNQGAMLLAFMILICWIAAALAVATVASVWALVRWCSTSRQAEGTERA